MHRRYKIALVISFVTFGAVLFTLSPVFYVKEIIINGCESISESEIITKAGLNTPINMFMFNSRNASDQIKENLYIESVSFDKTLPNTLTISIRERHLSGYVEYMQGKYLYIDENGRVLEINSYFTESLPVVSGLKFTKVRLGEILEVENTAAFRTVVNYARLLHKHQLTDIVSRINVSDHLNTQILLYHIDFQLGDGQNADEKIRTIKEIVEKLPNAEVMTGFVDLREIRSQYFFKILT